jgi:hypothetical protein
VAHHHVCVRALGADGHVNVSRFQVPPTLSGLRTVTTRLAPYPGVLAVTEPTSMTWLRLAVALQDAGSEMAATEPADLSFDAALLIGSLSPGWQKNDSQP